MTYLADMSIYDGAPRTLQLRSVGWLDAEQAFTTGFVDSKFIESLGRLITTSSTRRTRGLHRCNICSHDVPLSGRVPPTTQEVCGRGGYLLGGAEIWVEGAAGSFAAPDMIFHYVVSHRYKPPDQFIDAVMNGVAIEADGL